MIKDITLDNSLKTILGSGGNVQRPGEMAGEGNFESTLRSAISEVNNLQKEAETTTNELLKGGASIHDTVIAVEKADLSFRLMMKVRSKILNAYQEVMRMQV